MKNTAKNNSEKMRETKHCHRCKTTQPIENFYPNRAGCKACLRADSRKRNPDYQRTHPESTKAKVRRWQKKNPDRVRDYAVKGMRKVRRRRRERGTPELPLALDPKSE